MIDVAEPNAWTFANVRDTENLRQARPTVSSTTSRLVRRSGWAIPYKVPEKSLDLPLFFVTFAKKNMMWMR